MSDKINGHLEAGTVVEIIGDFRLDLDADGIPPYATVVTTWDEPGRPVTIRLFGLVGSFEYGCARAEVKLWKPAPKTREALERWLVS